MISRPHSWSEEPGEGWVIVGPTAPGKNPLHFQTKQFMISPDSVPVTPAELSNLCSFLLKDLSRSTFLEELSALEENLNTVVS